MQTVFKILLFIVLYIHLSATLKLTPRTINNNSFGTILVSQYLTRNSIVGEYSYYTLSHIYDDMNYTKTELVFCPASETQAAQKLSLDYQMYVTKSYIFLFVYLLRF